MSIFDELGSALGPDFVSGPTINPTYQQLPANMPRKHMKPYEEINFPNGFLRFIREDGMYVCRMTEEYMEKMKAQHEVKREWVGLTPDEVFGIADQHPVEGFDPDIMAYTRAIEQALKEKNK